MRYGWKTTEFHTYLTSLVQSLRPDGLLVLMELQKTDNLIVTIFFKDVLGFDDVPGITEQNLREILSDHALTVQTIFVQRGCFITLATPS